MTNEDDSIMHGEDRPHTKHWKEEMDDAEKAEILHDVLRVLMLLREKQMEEGEPDEQ